MEIYAVKINGFEKPIGYLFDTLLCSWKVRGAKGNKQANAHIAVSTDPALDTVLYEVSKAELDALGVPLGLRLAPCTRYYYRVTVTSDLGEIAQSNIEWFETGKLDQPWEAQWLGFEDDTRHPEFAKTFRLDRDVAQARLYICGLGLFEADINGKKAGNDFLAPFINDYEEHVQYCTYDVTDLLSADNELRVRLGKGWWMGRFGLAGRQNPERGFALIAELRVWYKDGGEAVIGTDASWSCRGSVFELSDIYDGEIQNHLLWEGRENPWQPANITSAPAALTARYSPPLHAMEALGVKEHSCNRQDTDFATKKVLPKIVHTGSKP